MSSPMPFGWGGLGCHLSAIYSDETSERVSNAFRLGWFGLPATTNRTGNRHNTVSNAFRLGWFGLPCACGRSRQAASACLQCLSAGVVWAAIFATLKDPSKLEVSNAFRLGWFGLPGCPGNDVGQQGVVSPMPFGWGGLGCGWPPRRGCCWQFGVSNAFRLGWFGLLIEAVEKFRIAQKGLQCLSAGVVWAA